MKIASSISAMVLACSVLSIIPAIARADRIEPTIPGAAFTVPGMIGAFNYSLPQGSVVRQVGLGSPVYSFPAANQTFYLCFESGTILGGCLGLTPADTSFYLGSILLTYPNTSAFPLTGPLPLTVRCLAGPCPTTYTRTGGAANWALGIDFDPPQPPIIGKSFGDGTVPQYGTTSLGFTLGNPNASIALTGVGFNDTLPAGLVVSNPNGLTGSCGGGTITAAAGSVSVNLTGATLAASTQCTFSVNVTGSTAGTKSNTTGNVTSIEGGSGSTASASTSVLVPANIPTLQQWAMWVLCLLILVATAAVLSHPRKNS